MSEWQTIETAPMDGTEVFLWVPERHYECGGRMVKGAFRLDAFAQDDDEPTWLKDDYDDYSTGYASTPIAPSHWMPLPAPPTR